MKKTFIVATIVAGIFCMPVAYADTALSVTVTPPLFQLTISPGQSWKSSLKVVNSNPYEVTYYAQPMDFSGEGETGHASLAPVVNVPTDGTAATYSLAHWIQISFEPIVVPAGRSAEIPFTVTIPANAEPGGHYAALLVGTQPPKAVSNGPSMKISSFVSSLLFVRVEGAIDEKARIREFRTENSLYQNPEANFLVRFENLGNTHLRPEGVITIYNMWGKERGKLIVNQEKNFGNVLPKSIRKFTFEWSGNSSVFDIGQYRAEVTMNFGDKNKQNISATTYFWVVPVVPVSATVFGILLFALLMVWFIRRYIRRVLALESKVLTGLTTTLSDRLSDHPPQISLTHHETYSLRTLVEPIREGVIDLRRVSSIASQNEVAAQRTSAFDSSTPRTFISLTQFLAEYRIFFLFVIVLFSAGITAYVFFARVLVPLQPYSIHDVSTQVENAPVN